MVTDLALSITAIGVIAAVIGLRQSYRERLRQFESLYVQRYWSILDRLSLDALASLPSRHIAESDRRAIRSYLLLCEDELEMRESGYIGDNTYALWAEGILAQIEQPMFKDVWNEVCNDAAFPYQHLKSLLKEGHTYEPLKMSTLRRRLRGLKGIGSV